MKLMMISGDRSILAGKRGAFWLTLEEFHKHWERIDVLCSRGATRHELRDTSYGLRAARHENGEILEAGSSKLEARSFFGNVFFHSSPHSLWRQIGRAS